MFHFIFFFKVVFVFPLLIYFNFSFQYLDTIPHFHILFYSLSLSPYNWLRPRIFNELLILNVFVFKMRPNFFIWFSHDFVCGYGWQGWKLWARNVIRMDDITI